MERELLRGIRAALLEAQHYLDASGVLRQDVSVPEVLEHTPAARQIRLPLS